MVLRRLGWRRRQNPPRKLVNKLYDLRARPFPRLIVRVWRRQLIHHRLVAANAVKGIVLHDRGVKVDVPPATGVDESKPTLAITRFDDAVEHRVPA
jgi:hypothetical protein